MRNGFTFLVLLLNMNARKKRRKEISEKYDIMSMHVRIYNWWYYIYVSFIGRGAWIITHHQVCPWKHFYCWYQFCTGPYIRLISRHIQIELISQLSSSSSNKWISPWKIYTKPINFSPASISKVWKDCAISSYFVNKFFSIFQVNKNWRRYCGDILLW